jgi:catechol 2,3-dioxygenase-like lactoylglutathione lyase family enzyme
MLARPRYVIAVQDLDRSTAFWRDVLGFEVDWEDVPGWRLFVRDACLVMAGECPDSPPARDIGDHSYIAYIESSDIDALHAELVERGVDLIKPLRDEPWGMREFGLRTPDGHRLMFGAPL